MKFRAFLLAIAAAAVIAVPVARAQSPDGGGIGYIPGAPGQGVAARNYTSAVLVTPDGQRIGKAKTATIKTATGAIQQGIKVVAQGLAPNTEYALVLDNTLVGTATSDARGTVKFRFSDPAIGSATALPDALKPIAAARTVQIYATSTQTLVASGTFSTGR
jgi:hypothetical protein